MWGGSLVPRPCGLGTRLCGGGGGEGGGGSAAAGCISTNTGAATVVVYWRRMLPVLALWMQEHSCQGNLQLIDQQNYVDHLRAKCIVVTYHRIDFIGQGTSFVYYRDVPMAGVSYRSSVHCKCSYIVW